MYILHDTNLIYGTGETEEAALEDARSNLARAGLSFSSLGVHLITKASQRLVGAVVAHGGNVAWRIHDGSGVAVTIDEYDSGVWGNER